MVMFDTVHLKAIDKRETFSGCICCQLLFSLSGKRKLNEALLTFAHFSHIEHSIKKKKQRTMSLGQNRSFSEEARYIKNGPKEFPNLKIIDKGFVPGMRVVGKFYADDQLEKLCMDELQEFSNRNQFGGFLPAVKQIANVAGLPGIVKHSIAMPDVHAGYGFAIGNVAAFDMENPESVVSPGGVGFDINCGVRLLRTNLDYKDVRDIQESVAQALFNHIPVGVGSKGIIPTTPKDLHQALEMGIDWSIRQGYAWAEDKEHCEEYGRMLNADATKVSQRAQKRGLPQMGTLGAGNHYMEVQRVEKIFDKSAAKKMGIDRVNQICVMIHSGSRGLGHQVATDALVKMEKAMARDKIHTNDKQLACARINSEEGKEYLDAMAAAANYAWVNRSSMTFLARFEKKIKDKKRFLCMYTYFLIRKQNIILQAFQKIFKQDADDLDMHVVYDVSHNIAKVEQHMVDGKLMKLLVHRKGSTRAFPPHHPLIPVDYQVIGQPVLIGGTMGTSSFVLTGTEKGMRDTFGSTCHGAGRAMSRNKSRKTLDYKDVLNDLKKQGISIRVASPKLVMEEAPESYKDVTSVVDVCHTAGISKKCIQLKPIAVIKVDNLFIILLLLASSSATKMEK
ncbi:hypothetical protein RFI_26453 [Reticulomyxa filosa]|uniref:RNA-splicing ligase RtcB homolog n=1 Tax=Reticulomyxa filosa TaxID=46433 RepID=X6MD26_RETFI|nr:hypothetical protein RFI_26453 [Reticulomyxa filosa]|eukprot:ETO10925.1 hypothetical protein RFI_26453 [Reticulomyxa filosa]